MAQQNSAVGTRTKYPTNFMVSRYSGLRCPDGTPRSVCGNTSSGTKIFESPAACGRELGREPIAYVMVEPYKGVAICKKCWDAQHPENPVVVKEPAPRKEPDRILSFRLSEKDGVRTATPVEWRGGAYYEFRGEISPETRAALLAALGSDVAQREATIEAGMTEITPTATVPEVRKVRRGRKAKAAS